MNQNQQRRRGRQAPRTKIVRVARELHRAPGWYKVSNRNTDPPQYSHDPIYQRKVRIGISTGVDGINFTAKMIADACGMAAAFTRMSLRAISAYGPTNQSLLCVCYVPTSGTAGYQQREFQDAGVAGNKRACIKVRISPRDVAWTNTADDTQANRLFRAVGMDDSGGRVDVFVVVDFEVMFQTNAGAVLAEPDIARNSTQAPNLEEWDVPPCNREHTTCTHCLTDGSGLASAFDEKCGV